jgi:hypothetical protein
MAYAWNPSYLGDWDNEDHGLRKDQAKKFVRPHLNGKKLEVVLSSCPSSNMESLK